MKNATANEKSVIEVDVIVWKKVQIAAQAKKMTPEAYASFLLAKRFNQPSRKTA